MSPPRLGFLGVGWIGRHRMQAIRAAGHARIACIADEHEGAIESARESAPEAKIVSGLDGLLDEGVDGVVIATPSALHASQSIAALRAGTAVFCQKPLGRTAAEVTAVIDAARGADRLLGVDLSYRHTAAVQAMLPLLRAGAIGRIYAVDLVFHNAYGPDKPWFYDVAQSGGGCVIDLGVHLVDLALHALGFPEVAHVHSNLHAGGERLGAAPSRVEDHAVATLELADGTVVRLACSWRLPIGRDAQIEARFHGTQGGLGFSNVNGSFYDFVAERYDGTRAERLAQPPDEWGGRAAVEFSRRLAAGERYDPSARELLRVAEVLDRIYVR